MAQIRQPPSRPRRPPPAGARSDWPWKVGIQPGRIRPAPSRTTFPAHITLPVPEPHRAYLRSIGRGERPLGEVLEAISDAEARLAALRDSPVIGDQPDRRWVDDWLHRSYLNFWAGDH